LSLVEHDPGCNEPDFPLDAVRAVSGDCRKILFSFILIAKSIVCLCEFDIDFPMIIFTNISIHVLNDIGEFVKFTLSHLVINFFVQFEILEPERRVFNIVFKALFADVYGFFELIFALFEP
jgi:hypothetical protein